MQSLILVNQKYDIYLMKNETLINFGMRICQIRKMNNLSQEQLAERTGFHRTYIGMIERGERNPALKNIKIFADKLDISLSELFDYDVINKEVKSGKIKK